MVSQKKRVKGLKAKDRVGQILLIALFHRSWHQLNSRLEVPAGLFDLLISQIVLQVMVGLGSAGIAGQFASLHLIELSFGAIVAILELDDILFAGKGHRVVQLATDGVGLLRSAVWVEDGPVLVSRRLIGLIFLRFARRLVLFLPGLFLLTLFLITVNVRQRYLHTLYLLDLPRKLSLFDPYKLENAANSLWLFRQRGEMAFWIEL